MSLLRFTLVAGTLLLVPCVQAFAATLSVAISGQPISSTDAGNFSESQDIDSSVQSILSKSRAETTSVDDVLKYGITPVTGDASASASVNSSTGQLKISASTSADVTQLVNNQAHVSASLWETFTYSGTGTLTTFMDITGNYDISSIGDIDITYGRLFFDSLQIGYSGPPPGSGGLNTTLSADQSLNGSGAITLYWIIAADLYNDGFVDFLHTANIFYSTTGTLALAPNDPNFLSNPAYLNTVPLPAALPHFLTGLAGMGFLTWRRTRRQTA